MEESNFIVGLVFEISGTDLKQHFVTRAQHHRNREKTYRESMKSIPEDEEDTEYFLKNHSNSPRRTQQEKADYHRKLAEIHEWRANHTMVSKNYRLSENDLSLAEIITR